MIAICFRLSAIQPIVRVRRRRHLDRVRGRVSQLLLCQLVSQKSDVPDFRKLPQEDHFLVALSLTGAFVYWLSRLCFAVDERESDWLDIMMFWRWAPRILHTFYGD